VRHLTEFHGIVLPTILTGGGNADSPLSMLTASGSAVKTRAAFCLVTTVLTKVSRQLCRNVFSVRRSARCPFRPINLAAIKQECKLYCYICVLEVFCSVLMCYITLYIL